MTRVLFCLFLVSNVAHAERFVRDAPSEGYGSQIPLDWSTRRVVSVSAARPPRYVDSADWLCRANAAFGPSQPGNAPEDLHFYVRDSETGARLSLLVDGETGLLQVRGREHAQRAVAAEALLDSLHAAPSVDCTLSTIVFAEGRVFEVKDGVSSSREATSSEILALHAGRIARLDGIDEKKYREWSDPRWRIDDAALNFWTTHLSEQERSAHLEVRPALYGAARRFLARPGAVGMSGLGRKAMCSYLTKLTRALPPQTTADRTLWAAARAKGCR